MFYETKKMNIKDFPKTSDIILNYENGWLDIHLNNVENRNALKQNLIKELFTVFDMIRSNEQVRGVLIRGSNGIFCSGADLKQMKKMREVERNELAACKPEQEVDPTQVLVIREYFFNFSKEISS